MDALSSVLEFKTFQDRLIFILLSSGAWYALFIGCIRAVQLPKFDKRTAINIKQKLVALIYDIFVLCGPVYLYLTRGMPTGLNDDPIDLFLLLESCGYYIAHFIIVVSYRITHKGQILHHILTIATILAGAYNRIGEFGLLWLFIYQLSHFPLHFRALLKDVHKSYTKLYEFIEICYFATYLFERLVGGSWLIYYSIFVIPMPWWTPVIGSCLYMQSLYFCYHMFKLFPKKYAKYRERCAKNISYNWIEDNEEVEKLSYYRREEKEKIF